MSTDLKRVAYIHRLLTAAVQTTSGLGFTEEEIVDAMLVYGIDWYTRQRGYPTTAQHFADVAERLRQAGAQSTRN